MGKKDVMAKMRSYLIGLLALVLVLTGQSVAMARGMPLAAGLIEICAGDRAIMIVVDEDGQPTGAAHICPEFTLDIVDPVPAFARPSHAQRYETLRDTGEAGLQDRQVRMQSGDARAPPQIS